MPGIRTVCHKLRPVHYDYHYHYDYWYTDNPLQEDQTKRRETKWQHNRDPKKKNNKNSKVNPISVQRCIWLHSGFGQDYIHSSRVFFGC